MYLNLDYACDRRAQGAWWRPPPPSDRGLRHHPTGRTAVRALKGTGVRRQSKPRPFLDTSCDWGLQWSLGDLTKTQLCRIVAALAPFTGGAFLVLQALHLNKLRIVRAFVLGAAMISLAACNKASGSNSGQAAATPPYEHLTGTGPPVYAAIDYDKPGHPSMTAEQARAVREMLARVKPCQRSLLRYVLDEDVTLFFAVPLGQGARVLGNPGLIYVPESGSEIPVQENGPEADARAKEGVQWDIDHEPCSH
jgi:hypothetical protein